MSITIKGETYSLGDYIQCKFGSDNVTCVITNLDDFKEGYVKVSEDAVYMNITVQSIMGKTGKKLNLDEIRKDCFKTLSHYENLVGYQDKDARKIVESMANKLDDKHMKYFFAFRLLKLTLWMQEDIDHEADKTQPSFH